MQYDLSISNKILKHLKTLFETYLGFFIISFRYFFSSNRLLNKSLLENEVTLVITSCNRFENLKSTIDSFLKFNTYSFSHVIHIEDGQSIESIEFIKKTFTNCNIISLINDSNKGQLNSIDIAYSKIQTEYFFHLEEDWSFIEYGFIEKSINILSTYKNVLYVSLRSFYDQNGHPLINFNDSFFKYKPFWKLAWIGFGFNPSLRRTKDALVISKFGGSNKRETGIGIFYYLILNKVIIIPKKEYYVEHNGWLVSTVNKYKKA
jgi:hypothetical protein